MGNPYSTTSTLCLPVKSEHGDRAGVAPAVTRPCADGPFCEARGASLGSAARKLTGNHATSILLKVFSKGSVHCTGSLEP